MSDQQSTSTGKSRGLWLSRAALGFVALAAVMGWGASFVGLHAYGQDQMVGFSYWSAWLIPATFDGAAFGATLITYRASIHGRSALRGRLLMWIFTAISSWINWIHQTTPEARIVAAGLPVAAVAVFDVVLAELRADYEERHGKRRLRLRPGLLALRWLVDRGGTSIAFRQQVTDIPVSEIAGLGTSAAFVTGGPSAAERPALSDAVTEAVADKPEKRAIEAPEPEPKAEAKPEPAAKVEPKPTARVEPVTEVQPEPTAKVEPKPEPTPEPVAEVEAKPEPKPEPEVKAEPEPADAEPVKAEAQQEETQEEEAPTEEAPKAEAPAEEPAHAGAERSDRDAGEETLVLPVVPVTRMSDQDKREAARRDYRRSVEEGQPLSGSALGRRYGFSRSWGQSQITAVRAERRQEELVSVD